MDGCKQVSVDQSTKKLGGCLREAGSKMRAESGAEIEQPQAVDVFYIMKVLRDIENTEPFCSQGNVPDKSEVADSAIHSETLVVYLQHRPVKLICVVLFNVAKHLISLCSLCTCTMTFDIVHTMP